MLIDHVLPIGRIGPIVIGFFSLLPLFQTSFELSVRRIQITLKPLSIDHRIARRIGCNQARIAKKLLPVYESAFHTLPHHALKKTSKQLCPPTPSRLAEHAVVRDLGVQLQSQKPQPVQPLRQGRHQLPFTPHVVQHQQQHQLNNHRRRH